MTYTQQIYNHDNREPILEIWRKINEREERQQSSMSMSQEDQVDEGEMTSSPSSN